MNVVQAHRPAKIGRAVVGEASNGPAVQFYDEIPNHEMSLDDFEVFALSRLKVLRKIEELKLRNITGDSYRTQLEATIKTNLGDQTRDIASHFILRAAYCRTEDLRRWFLTQEGHLFRHRLEFLPEHALQAALKNINVEKVSTAQKNSLREKLLSTPGVTIGDFASTPFYALPFTQALDLVATRSCLVADGLAYVALPKVVSILMAKFRTALSLSLVRASAAFNHVEEEGRIAPLLKTMNSHCTDKKNYTDLSIEQHQLSAASIDAFVANMPLCMSQAHSGLKQDHKLKHWGRLQYGLFLKGAGMSMEESMLFFQREFSKIMTSDQFQKNYAYNVRHMYGKEGKRASYTPYNCQKIIMGQAPQAGEHHGCPFRHYDEQHLAALLHRMSIGTPVERNDILRLKRSNNFQLACLKHFEVVHAGVSSMPSVDRTNLGNHPNAWFSASVAYHARIAGGSNSESQGPSITVSPEKTQEQ